MNIQLSYFFNKPLLLAVAFLASVAAGSIYAQDVFEQQGIASFYADKFEGRPTSNGEIYTHDKMTAAHLTLPFNTRVKVTNKANGKTVVVRINDRGPFVEGRIIDLSRSAAKKLGLLITGLAEVKIEKVEEPKKPEDNDDNFITDNSDKIQEPEFFKIEASKTNPDGFGLQLGSFVEVGNVLRASETLKKNYQKNVSVMITRVNDREVYRVILGSFKDRSEAESIRGELLESFPDCFVIDYQNL